MKQADELLLKHYQNIKQLTCRQLQAIETGNIISVNELIAQKNLIIDIVRSLETEYTTSELKEETRKGLEQLLTDILAMEERSQTLLADRKESLRGQIMALRKGKILHNAYEAPVTTGHVVNRSK